MSNNRSSGVAAPAVAALLGCALASTASAAVVTWDYTLEYTGATAPTGPVPWLRATIDDEGTAGSVNLTLEALNLTNREFVSRWLFNLDPALNLSQISVGSVTTAGSFATPIISLGQNQFHAGGAGRFDLLVDFSNSPPRDRFTAGDSLMFTLIGNGITADDFLFRSTGPARHLYTSAHVQGIDPNAQLSGWVTIPEPSGLLPAALLAGALLGRRRRGA